MRERIQPTQIKDDFRKTLNTAKNIIEIGSDIITEAGDVVNTIGTFLDKFETPTTQQDHRSSISKSQKKSKKRFCTIL